MAYSLRVIIRVLFIGLIKLPNNLSHVEGVSEGLSQSPLAAAAILMGALLLRAGLCPLPPSLSFLTKLLIPLTLLLALLFATSSTPFSSNQGTLGPWGLGGIWGLPLISSPLIAQTALSFGRITRTIDITWAWSPYYSTLKSLSSLSTTTGAVPQLGVSMATQLTVVALALWCL